LLFLDEPSLALAQMSVSEIFNTIRQLRESGLIILLVEQMAKKARAFADRGYVLENGRVTLEGGGWGLARSLRRACCIPMRTGSRWVRKTSWSRSCRSSIRTIISGTDRHRISCRNCWTTCAAATICAAPSTSSAASPTEPTAIRGSRFASVGEVEYANGVGAFFASNYHGPLRACAGIVGKVDLTLGAFAEEVLKACIACAPDRFRGIRHVAAWDASPEVDVLIRPPKKALLLYPQFRAGFAKLAPLNLSYDAWVYHPQLPQLPQLIELADGYSDTRIVVDHIGGLVATGPYSNRQGDHFAQWKASMQALAQRPNVFVKIGGLSMRGHGCTFIDRELPPTSEELAQAWKPHVDACIERFGPERCMFESNFPPDKCGVSARTLWNAFKRLAAGCSKDEKTSLFAGTAIRAYRLPESLGEPAQKTQKVRSSA
jgi:L-fuconolactonase